MIKFNTTKFIVLPIFILFQCLLSFEQSFKFYYSNKLSHSTYIFQLYEAINHKNTLTIIYFGKSYTSLYQFQINIKNYYF